MKKKMLSLATVLCLGIGFIGGCKKDENTFNKLNLDGHDIVLMLGDNTKYTADDLFGEMLNSELGSKTAYEKILKMIVENTIESDANMETSWDLMLEKFEESVQSKSLSEGISEDEAREALLLEEGYSSIEEKKDAYIYGVKLSKLQEKYWNERKGYYYEQYFNARLPYYVKHILVKTGYSSSRAPYASVIDSDDAKDLYDVYSLLAKGEKFAYVMNHKSEDATDGNGYHMDLTTSFVTEFLHGVFALDSLMKDETSKVQGLNSEILDYYVNGATMGEDGDYKFNVIYASDLEVLGKEATGSDANKIYTYENDEEDGDKEVSVGQLSDSSAYGSNSAMYTRSVIFNRTFNNPGISVISLDNNFTGSNYMELTINGKTHKLLTDEKGNLVFIACAKGSSSDYWVHFLTVDVSPFDDKAKLFYSFDQKATIDGMIEAKKTELATDSSLNDTQRAAALDEYREELEEYQTYVDIKGGETQVGRNKIIQELEGYVKTYAQRGITSGAVAGQEQFMTYDMVYYYMSQGEVVIKDETIKNLVTTYINNQKALIDLKSINSIAAGWNEYYERVALANSEEIANKKVPLECAYGANAGASCKFNYDEENGFELVITYKNVGDSNTSYLPTDSTTYTTSYKIGEGTIVKLPGVGTDATNGMTRTGYTFAGWYSTSTYDEGTEVTEIDTSRSSTQNKIVLYAKWAEVVSGGEGNE